MITLDLNGARNQLVAVSDPKMVSREITGNILAKNRQISILNYGPSGSIIL